MKIDFIKIRSLKLFLTSILFMFVLTSCTSVFSKKTNEPDDFMYAISKMTKNTYLKVSSLTDKNEVILVSDFVNIDNLKNNSKLGFLLSETLKNELSSKNVLVKEVKLGKNFKFGQHGLTILSRNLKEINSDAVDERFAMVGTYSITHKRLILFIKFIDIRTGHILSSSSSSVSMNKEISNLDGQTKSTRDIYQPLTL